LNLIFIFKKDWKENIIQDLRIYTCQPNFTTAIDTQQFKTKRLFYGFINFIKNQCEHEKIKINIKFKNYEKIKEDRIKAIKNDILTNPREVPATIFYKGKKYRADVRLKGDLSNHWKVNKQWSLRIELKDKKSINKMKEFSITKLIERRYPDNLLISNQFQRLGLISPNFKIYKVDLNGENWGLMIAEEQFSNVFLENRKLKDGIIFKFTNEAGFFLKKYLTSSKNKPFEMLFDKQGKIEVDIFNKKKIRRLKNLQDHETLVKSVNGILNSNYENKEKYNLIKKFFNIEKLASLIANTLVFQSFHTLQLANTRFYLNPYNLKIEPIPTDNYYEKKHKSRNITDYHNMLDSIPNVSIYTLLYEDETFISEYKKSLLKIKSDLEIISKDSDILCKKFESYCREIVDLKDLEDRVLNLIKFGENIFPDKKLIKKNKLEETNIKNTLLTQEELNAITISNSFIYARLFSDYLKVYNLIFQEVKLNDIYLYYNNSNTTNNCKFFIKKNCIVKTYNLDENLNKSLNEISFKKIELDLNNSKNLVWGEINGSVKNKNFKYKIRLENNKFDEDKLIENVNYDKNFLNNLSGNTYIISGKLNIDKPIVVPKNYNLKIASGSELIFNKNAYIYLNGGNLFLDGEKKIIKLIPKNETWRGIYVNNALEKSKINNAKIVGTKNFEHNGIFLTGGINFYKSDIEILNTEIFNTKSEDAINIIKSNFSLQNVRVNNSLSDGIDSDFSNGSIKESIFENIGGDAIDTSGSTITIINTKIYKVNDKALSAGEKSKINIKNVLVESSKFGLVSKDLSTIEGDHINISNSIEFDVMAFQKKMHYGPGFINIDNVKFDNKIIAQTNSEIKINNKKVISENFDPIKYY